MKKNILRFTIITSIALISLIIYLSTVGLETEKFNKQIRQNINETNNNLDIELKKIKLTLDPVNFKVNAKTIGATIFYSKKPLSLEYIKTQVSLVSLIKNKIISSKIEIATRSILLKDLVRFIRASNNTPQLFILEKIIDNGHVIIDLKINFDEFGNIKKDYELKGLLKDGKVNFLKNRSFENINFNFNLKKDNYLFQDVKFTKDKINFTSELLSVKKQQKTFLIEGSIENNISSLDKNFLKVLRLNLKHINLENTKFTSKNKFTIEIDNKFNLKNTVFNSDINIDQFKYIKPKIISNYFLDINETVLLKDHNLKLNYNNNKLLIKGDGKIKLEEKFDKIDYFINKKEDDFNFSSNLKIESINIKKLEFLKDFFPLAKDKINLKKQEINIKYSNKNVILSGEGKVKIDKEFEDIKYFISKKNNNFNFDFDLSLNQTNFKIDQLNFKKNDSSTSKLKVKGNIEKNNILSLEYLNFYENKNKIEINNLILGKDKLILKLDKANFDYLDNENKENQFIIKKEDNYNYRVTGLFFNANPLITNLLKDKNEKDNKFFQNNININLDLNQVYIDEINFIQNLNGKLIIQNNKVTSAQIFANYDNKDKIFFKIITDKEGNKITTLTSSWAKPLVNRYKFIKGFEEGYLDLRSVKKDGISNSILIIDNFKVKEIPVLAKLLALASLQGIADLLTGEGIRFTDFEMKFSNDKKLMRIEELYAIGPSISVLMEGYIEADKLISLRGTLVPASTINRSIASIPFIGDLLVGKKVGEGVFGVSFKIKGPPKNLETTVNPIKTLTPRFITRTLEKIKKN